MTTLVEFLLARIAEDEAVARSVIAARTRPRSGPPKAWWMTGPGLSVQDGGASAVARSSAPVSEHIARHDPARVLAECEAKRKIVELARIWIDSDRTDTYAVASRQELAGVLHQMVVPYRDHPDCDPKWLPMWANWPAEMR